jgi:hypothetical protein
MHTAHKPTGLILIAAIFLIAAAATSTSRAQTAFGVQLNGVLTTQVATKTGNGLKSTPINNNTIIAAVLASSTDTTLTKKDVVLAMGSATGHFAEFAVIKVSGTTITELADIGSPGNNETAIAEFSKDSKTITAQGTFLPYTFTLPIASGTSSGGTAFKAVIVSGSDLKTASFTFLTGQGFGNNGASQFQGTIHLNGKKY